MNTGTSGFQTKKSNLWFKERLYIWLVCTSATYLIADNESVNTNLLDKQQSVFCSWMSSAKFKVQSFG